MRKICWSFILLLFISNITAQIKWTNVDSLYQPLPSSAHIYFTNEPIDTAPFKAYYLIVDLKDKKLEFTADTTYKRRLTPSQFFERNNHSLVVVNCTFFSFQTNQNLNVVIKDGKLVSHNIHSIAGRGKDTLTYKHPMGSALGISKKRIADVAWLFTDSVEKYPIAYEKYPRLTNDSERNVTKFYFYPYFLHGPTILNKTHLKSREGIIEKWKMQTAVGGGPVLLQDGEIRITNEEELKFTGKAINDKHPRTAMGYTKDNKLIILMIEGRNTIAHGATLIQEAQILKDLGCWEALNLDGGGSSCMLVNGKETIMPSDKEGQRPVPAVFIIKSKK